MIIGNPNAMPVLKATPNFSGFGIIDGIQYQAGGVLGFTPVNTFFRQVRNLVLDITAIPASSEATCLHWPTAQATSLQNIVFKMSDKAGTMHRGIFIEGMYYFVQSPDIPPLQWLPMCKRENNNTSLVLS